MKEKKETQTLPTTLPTTTLPKLPTTGQWAAMAVPATMLPTVLATILVTVLPTVLTPQHRRTHLSEHTNFQRHFQRHACQPPRVVVAVRVCICTHYTLSLRVHFERHQ